MSRGRWKSISQNSQWYSYRKYHSYVHESTPPFSPTENTILTAAVAHVPAKGFNVDALVCGARDVGYRDISVNLFPTGAFALVRYHLITQRLALANANPSGENQVGIAANVRRLALQRLHGNKLIAHRWQEVVAYPRLYLAVANTLIGACFDGHTIPPSHLS